MKKYTSQLLLISSLFILMTGCLKDEAFDNGTIQSVRNTGPEIKPVEIKLTATNTSNFFVLGVNNSANDTTVNLMPINLATAAPAPEDLHITISLDEELVNDYNTEHGTSYAIPPASLYNIVSNEAVIPKGSNTGYVQIKLKPSDFIGGNWALGFKIDGIKEAGYTVSGNLSKGMTVIVIKNAYDGKYNSTGYFYHPSARRPLEQTKELSTVSENSVACGFGDLGGSGYVALLTVDPVTNKVTVSDYSTGIPIVGFDNGLPASNPGYTPQWSGSSQCNNTYDPATKTFYIRMGYVGPTGWRVSEEILVRQ